MLGKTLFGLSFFNKNAERNKQQNSIGETLNPLNNVSVLSSIDNTSNVKYVFGKVDKLGELWDKGTADASFWRYIPGLSNVLSQGKIFNIVPKKRTRH